MRWWILAFAMVLLAVWGRVWWSAQADLATAQEAEQTGQIDRALEYYQYAARWYTIGASAPAEGLASLERIGLKALADGHGKVALKAFRRLRGAILATRGILEPGIERLDSTNSHIAELMASEQLDRGGVTLRGRTKPQLVADHLALLRLDPVPSRAWSLLIILSFFGWIGACVLVIRRGFSSQLVLERGPMLRWGGVAVAFFGLWILGLMQA